MSKRDKGTIKYRKMQDGRTVFTFKKKLRAYDKLIFMYLLRSMEHAYPGQVDSFQNEVGHLVIRHTPGKRHRPKTFNIKSSRQLITEMGLMTGAA